MGCNFQILTPIEKYKETVLNEAYGWMTIAALEKQIAAMQAEVDRRREASKRRRERVKNGVPSTRIPDWCKPPWERRDKKSHVVYMTYSRNKGGHPMTGYWLWEDGKAIRCTGTKGGCQWMATYPEILLWDVKDWEDYKSKHPEIEAEIAKRRGADVVPDVV